MADGITVQAYEQNLAANLQDLHRRIHTGHYRPSPVKRVYIRKADGGRRRLGLPTLGKPHARICEGEAQWLSYSTINR
jgi:retron-type reverse transcriptase